MLGLLWGFIAERGVDTHAIIIAFDILEEIALGFFPCCPFSFVSEFHCKGVKEAFHGSVVITACRFAHRRHRFDTVDVFPIVRCRILAAAI